MSGFKRATKQAARLRLALIGPAGAGKTWTSLLLARELGGRVAVIDTERGSASKYADLFEFDALELADSFHPDRYVEAIRDAEAADYTTLIIDSLSHAWIGKDGGLDLHDKAVDRQKTKNSFTAWAEVTPKHNALVQALIGCRCHVIATMRSKTEYVLETQNGRQAPRKVGLGPVMRDGVEYEFDVVADMDIDNTLVVTKTRCPALAGQSFRKPGKDLARVLTAWLGSGPVPAPTANGTPALPSPLLPVVTPEPMTDSQGGRIDELCTALGYTARQLEGSVKKDYGHATPGRLTHDQAAELIARLEEKLADRARAAPPRPETASA